MGRVCLALLAILPVEGLRIGHMKHTHVSRWGDTESGDSCLDLSENVFPLPVDKMLEESDNTKSTYFEKLRKMGVDEKLSVTGNELHYSCLQEENKTNVKIFFLGDSTTRGLFIEFQERRGNKVSDEIKKQRMALAREVDTNKHQKTSEDKGHGKGLSANAEFIPWKGEDMVSKLKKKFDKTPKTTTVVFWMGTLLHNMPDPKGKNPQTRWWYKREETLRSFLAEMKEKIPEAKLIWDTPPFIDIPLLVAKPAKSVTIDGPGGWSEIVNALPTLVNIDEKVCEEMGVAKTARTKLGMAYRGMACDGLHYYSKYSSPGYDVFYEMILQSGLSEACNKKPANFCKNLDTDTDKNTGISWLSKPL